MEPAGVDADLDRRVDCGPALGLEPRDQHRAPLLRLRLQALQRRGVDVACDLPTVAPRSFARRATSSTSSRALSEIAIVIPVRWTTCTPSSASSGTSPTRSREAAEPARR